MSAFGLATPFYHRLAIDAFLLVAVGLILIAARFFLFGVSRDKGAILAVHGGSDESGSSTGEPRARQVLRYGFGTLWILDGLLQMQRAMPASLITSVIQPLEAHQPHWLVDLMNFGIGEWNRHPITAAAGSVWIQLAIGLWLILGRSGWFSRIGYAMALGWGLVVWVVGEALGQVFAPGASWLLGAPGGALSYVIAATLLFAPFSWWARDRIPKWLLIGFGVMLIGFGVLQAYPGRGSWHAQIPTMIKEMSVIPQYGILTAPMRALLSAVGPGHGAVLNAITVLVLVGTGVSLIVRRGLRVSVLVFGIFSVLVWWIVQDFGVVGGVGTDPNSMIPELLLVVAGYLGMRESSSVPELRGFWPESIGYAGRLFGVWVAVVSLVGIVPMAYATVNTSYSPELALDASGAPFAINRPEIPFTLLDQAGKPVSLARFAGKRVVLTNLDPVCTLDCPLIASELKTADENLSPSVRADTVFIGVVANPIFHSLRAVRIFDRREYMNSLSNWYFLTSSSLPALVKVWHEYGWGVTLPVNGVMSIHPDIIYIIDQRGVQRWLLPSTPSFASSLQSSFSALVDKLVNGV
ncbi:MAG: SCO family protein [Ferrimicrobium sp.]